MLMRIFMIISLLALSACITDTAQVEVNQAQGEAGFTAFCNSHPGESLCP